MKFYARIAADAGLPDADAKDLANRFGSNTGRVVTYLEGGAAPGLSLKETISLRYSVNEEMTLTPVDYLLRRTNAILFHAETLAALKQPVIDEMARLLGWDEDEKAIQLARLNAAIDESALAYLKKAATPAITH
jgi:glycerol-3-phosphate dehydrogenase